MINLITKLKPTSQKWLNQLILPYSECLHIAHDLSGLNKFEDRTKDHGINLADFLPEPRSLSQVLRLPTYTKEK